jgi:hypothetical protein
MTWLAITMTFSTPLNDLILRGYGGALIAVRGMGRKRYLGVVYKELGPDDGFIISAYFTSKINRKAIIWRSNQ